MRLIDLITPAAPPLCAGCDGWAGRGEPFCGRCRGALRWLAPVPIPAGDGLDAWAPVAYEGPARGAIRALKFRSVPSIAAELAAAIVAGAPPGWLEQGVDLVPVPLHPRRRRTRGYDQAERLAEAIAARTGVPVVRCLRRLGDPATQMGRGRGSRLLRLRDAYAVADGLPPPAGRRIVLVDDVMTTGATLRACAQALRTKGAVEVRALAYARTPGR